MPKHSRFTKYLACKISVLTRPDGANYYRVTLPKQLMESVTEEQLFRGSFVINKKAKEIIFYDAEVESSE